MRLLLSTGEPSGAAIAAELVREVRRHDSACEVHEAVGAAARQPVFGFGEGLAAAPRLARGQRAARTAAAAIRPDAAVLVSYAGFNLPLGRWLREHGVPVVYVAPPQVWAWGRWRTRALRLAADMVVCLFPFEPPLLQQAGVDAAYFGYPMLDVVQATASRAETLARLGLEPDDRYIVLLPGSRPSEVRYHAALFGEVWRRIERERFGCRAVFVSPEPVPQVPGVSAAPFEIRYHVVRHAECALAASGTVTVECAILGTPVVVSYHLSPVSRAAARALVRTRYFAMPNILAGRPVVPERLNPSVDWLARELAGLLGDSAQQAARQDLARVSAMLGPRGAMGRISDLVLACARRET